MSPLLRYLLLTAPALLAACSSDTSAPDAMDGTVLVINASAAPLEVLVDGQTVAPTLGVATVSAPIRVALGSHRVGLRTGGGAVAELSVNTVAGQPATAVALAATSAGVTARVLEDTGRVVPAGKSKLRVAHLSANAGAIEIWRTQPDFQQPVHIMTPFPYGASSPYLQSDPGTWEVFVTAPGSTTRLATTGPVTVPAGERRTVAIMDSAGVIRLRVVQEP